MYEPADINIVTGEVTWKGEVMTWDEYQYRSQLEILQFTQDLNDARDITSDIVNLPGDKPYFRDDWYFKMPPRLPQTGKYPFELGFIEE